MKIYRRPLAIFVLASSLFVIVTFSLTTEAQSKKSKYACAEANPESLCNDSNTCGSATSPCTVDVKRTRYAASVTPSTSNKKENAVFCVKSGTQVVWMSSQKNTGFVLDFGTPSPFEPEDTIIGGSNRQVTVTAKKQGCYRESVGACISGATYGMCGTGNAEMIVLP